MSNIVFHDDKSVSDVRDLQTDLAHRDSTISDLKDELRQLRVERNAMSDALQGKPGRMFAELHKTIRGLKRSRELVYHERNQVVAALSKLFLASLERHDENDEEWDRDWMWIVFIDLPTGQVSWHIQDCELSLFAHLPRLQGRVWDGHLTSEKYVRLGALDPSVSQSA